jgi:hypothetical protein
MALSGDENNERAARGLVKLRVPRFTKARSVSVARRGVE